jgi:cyclohexa-1,5-dienecarbonyl-CoA hydratase
MTAGVAPLRVERLEGGALWRVVFGAAKGNVLDATLTAALTGAFRDAAADRDVKAVVLEGQGGHFSFGASVEEHLPGQVAGMLRAFHGLFRAIAGGGVPVLAAVRGACLGGGLELAAFGQRVFASPDARLGQPEILLGVFAPVASLILAERVGRAHAEALCLTGRTLEAEEALRMGLVDVLADDPAEAALAWAREHLVPLSAASLRYAVRAVRLGLNARLETDLAQLERLYLDELMKSADAEEGLRAFLEKRKPQWRNA